MGAGKVHAGSAPAFVYCEARDLDLGRTWYSGVFVHRDTESLSWSGAKPTYEMSFRNWLSARHGGAISHSFCTWRDTAGEAAQERDERAANNRGFVNGAVRTVGFTRWRP